jgi:hypothetical protein
LKNFSIDLLKDLFIYRNKHVLKQASINNVKILASMISVDHENGFSKFEGLETSIDKFILDIKNGLKGI